ncbi:MAG: ABC transporter ATP-binding protein [Rhodobacteraceae bacterium]|nr:ABC transporter ATP-binding protein [Paracoccaceae bacterium]
MNTETPIIELRDIVKRFGTLTVLRDINFDIGRGEFFSLLGASGCGKTTLLRILAGIEQPSGGSLLIDGQPMAGVPANRRPTNMVFQSYAIFPHLNVEENIGYGLRNMALSKNESRARVAEAIGLVKLDGLATRNAHQLSGGQRQRVALARALVCRPKVLLLDEPLSALDKKLREEMQLELRALQRTVGITFVFVTHDQEEALTLSDRIAIMADGQVLQIDSPRGLYERPANRRVAEFVGTMNLLPGRVVSATGDRAGLDAGPLGRFEAAAIGAPAAGKEAFLALRPEKLILSEAAAGSGARLKGRVAEAAYLGDRIHYQVAVEGLERPLSVSVNNLAESSGFGIGADVGVSWAAEAGLILGP